MKHTSYLILSFLSVEYGVDEFKKYLINCLSCFWIEFKNKPTFISVKIDKLDEYIVDDIVYKTITHPQFSHIDIEWFFLNQKEAEIEKFSF
jgi:hypothetical protein